MYTNETLGKALEDLTTAYNNFIKNAKDAAMEAMGDTVIAQIKQDAKDHISAELAAQKAALEQAIENAKAAINNSSSQAHTALQQAAATASSELISSAEAKKLELTALIQSAEQALQGKVNEAKNYIDRKLIAASEGLEAAINIKVNKSFEKLFFSKIPRRVPKDLTSYIADGSFYKRLAGIDGFTLHEDIHVGDYIKMSRPISAYDKTGTNQTIGSQFVTIADIDAFMGRGPKDMGINYHHAVMVPGQGFGGTQHFGRSRMNSSNTTAGGYKGSEMFKETIGAIATSGSTDIKASVNQQLFAEFGVHLKTSSERLTNSINPSGYNRFGVPTGCSNNWEWTDVQAVLMSEIECYGSTVWSSSGYDTGTAFLQFALFAASNEAINNRSSYFNLKDIASSSSFCFVDDYGVANCYAASEAGFYVRPRFIIA